MFSIGLEKRALSRLTNFAVLLKHDCQGGITVPWDFLKNQSSQRGLGKGGGGGTALLSVLIASVNRSLSTENCLALCRSWKHKCTWLLWVQTERDNSTCRMERQDLSLRGDMLITPSVISQRFKNGNESRGKLRRHFLRLKHN